VDDGVGVGDDGVGDDGSIRKEIDMHAVLVVLAIIVLAHLWADR
jgi:hypothetical protein